MICFEIVCASPLRRLDVFTFKRVLCSALGSGKKGDNEKPPISCPPTPVDCNVYDTRKYGHCLPIESPPVQLIFPALPGVPTSVFRCTDGEVLGPYADKCDIYKNPEYFSFHHMSFFDMNLVLKPYRQQCPKTGRKP